MTDIAVQYHRVPQDRVEFSADLHRFEALGLGGVVFADHYNERLSPLAAMLAAAMAVDSLRVGSMVLGNDYRHPVDVAKQVATIALFAPGRVELGIGAGWMASDYELLGLDFDPASKRIARLAESIEVIRSCWRGGSEAVTGQHYHVAAHQAVPVPAEPPRIRVGGGGPKMLRLAATAGDIVSLNPRHRDGSTGLEQQGQDMTLDAVGGRIREVREWAGDRADSIEIEVPIRAVAVTDDPEPVLESIAPIVGLTPEDARESPYLAVGSVAEIVDRIGRCEGLLSLDRWVVMDSDIDALAPVLDQL